MKKRGKMNTGKQIVHKKPWTGCQTCKKKYARCDERRPVCSNCIKYRRVCQYAPPPDTKAFPPTQSSQAPQTNRGPSDTRPFSVSQARSSSLTHYALASRVAVEGASVLPSLDPYPESLLPLTPARRALLAFCKGFLMSFLIYTGATTTL